VNSPDRQPYYSGLDGVRGIAILLVLIHHAVPRAFPGGFLGVDTFFVLSGYLIMGRLIDQLERRGRISLRWFLERRILRIMPSMFCALTLYAALGLWTTHGSGLQVASHVLPALGHIANIIRAVDGPGSLGTMEFTWSLSQEEQFYFVLGPTMTILGVLTLRYRNVFGCGLLGLAFLVAVHRLHLSNGDLYAIDRAYYGPDTHCDGMAFGVALRCFMDRYHFSTRPLTIATIGGVIYLFMALILLDRTSPMTYQFGIVGTNIFAMVFIAASVATKRSLARALLEWPPLVSLGKISYEVYLFNILCGRLALELIGPDFPIVILLFDVAGTIVLAAVCFYVAVPPIRRFLQHFSTASSHPPTNPLTATRAAIP